MDSQTRQHSLEGGYAQPEEVGEQQYYPSESAPYPFNSYSKYYTQSEGRSRASSINSRSSASLSGGQTTDLTEEAEAQPPKLHPADGDGFLVEIDSGTGVHGSQDPGMYKVSFQELLALLENPATTAKLSPDHPIARLASFIKEESPSYASEFSPHPGFPAQLAQGRPSYGNYHAPAHDPYRGASSSFGSLGVRGSPQPWDDDASSVHSLPYETRHRHYDDFQSVASYPPPSHHHPRHLGSGRNSPQGFAPPLQRGPSAPSTFVHGGSGSPSILLPPPGAESDSSSRRRGGPQDGGPSHRYGTRESSRPYPSRQHSARSTTSVDSLSTDGGDRKPYPKEATAAQPLRALNREEETYVWNEEQGQLFRVTGLAPVQGELLVFPAGSYYKVYREELEIIPSDPAPRSNDWVRAQVCVPDCTGFRIANKRPATVRNHFASCRARESLSSDPLGRLCKLQIDAGRRQKAHIKKVDQLNMQGQQMDYRLPGGVRSRTASYNSNYSAESDRLFSQSNSGSHYGGDGDQQMQDLEHGPTEDAVLAMVNRSAAPRAGPSAEMQDEPDVAPSQWNGWLSTHGLEAPDSKHYRRSTMLPDEPTTTGSFLSMDE